MLLLQKTLKNQEKLFSKPQGKQYYYITKLQYYNIITVYSPVNQAGIKR
jgi:hypothetical protein